MRVTHFVNEQFGLEDIQKRRLKIARINELNDPFELLAAACPNQLDRKAWHDLKQRSATAFSLLCFSKSWRNPVQWSRYVDKHLGICWGFDIEESLLKSIS